MGLLRLTGIPSSLAQGHGGGAGEEALSYRNSPAKREAGNVIRNNGTSMKTDTLSKTPVLEYLITDALQG